MREIHAKTIVSGKWREISSPETRRVSSQLFATMKPRSRTMRWHEILCCLISRRLLFSAQLYSIMRHGIMLQSIGLNADRSGGREREISFPMFSMKNATRQIISIPPLLWRHHMRNNCKKFMQPKRFKLITFRVFLNIPGSWLSREVHMSVAIPHDPRLRRKISHRGHQSSDLCSGKYLRLPGLLISRWFMDKRLWESPDCLFVASRLKIIGLVEN